MTAKTDLELENQAVILDEAEFEEPYYFYDYKDNYWKLRQERGDMPDTRHNDLVDQLIQVLRWQYRLETYTIHREANFHETEEKKDKPLYPDVFVFKSKKRFHFKSYKIGVSGPPPEVIIEIISDDLPANDLVEKPKRYAAWGVAEYFVYDPRERKRKSKKPRLYGWRLIDGVYQELKPTAKGWLWSEQLDSWLAPAEEMVQLYDNDKNLRLTEAQALFQQVQIERQAKEDEQWGREAERQAKEVERQAKEAERRAKEAERQAKEAERRAKEVERQAKEAALKREEILKQQVEQMAEKIKRLEQSQNNSQG